MPINDPSAIQTAWRAPRLRILINGKPMPGAISADVTTNNWYQADRFSAEFAINHHSAPARWWDIEPPMMVQIDFTLFEAGAWQPLIIGEVEHQHVHQQTGLLQVEGKDLSMRLVEQKTQFAYLNQTSSEVATKLARAHGLTPQVTPTKGLVQRFYQADHTAITMNQFSRQITEWDLLMYLAQREGFDLFVEGKTLHFQPPTPLNADPFVIRWTPPRPDPRLNTVTLSMERSLTLAKDIEVSVRSWNSQQGRGFTKIAKAVGTKSASAAGVTSGGRSNPTQKYSFTRPNLTEDQALKLAMKMAAELSQHERIVNVQMPGELTLTPRHLVRLEGTGTSFDQVYLVDNIQRSLSFEGGFTQYVRLKNSSPREQTQVA